MDGERGEDFLGVAFRRDLQPARRDLAVGLDQEGVAGLQRTLRHQRAVHRGDGRFLIRQELEVQAFLRAEVLVGAGGVHAHAEHDRVRRGEFLQVLLESVRFDGAAAGKVLRVEVKRDPLSAVVVELHGLAVLSGQGEGGSLVSGSRGVGGEGGRGEEGEGEKEFHAPIKHIMLTR